MSDDEIFARIASDVWNIPFGVRDITIWMTIDLFNRLYPREFVIQKNSAMITLFGCGVKVVSFPCDSMQWIVGYEGKAEEGE